MTIHQKKIVKRKYSRAGCAECKRRKIKCDEAIPSCSLCVKVHKPCVYPIVKRKTKSRGRNELISEEDTHNYTPEVGAKEVMTEDRETRGEREAREATAEELLLFENVFDDANTLVNGLIDFESFAIDFNSLMPDKQVETGRDIKPFHSDILLNEDPKLRVFSNNAELESYLKGTDILNNPELAKSWYHFDLSMRDSEESSDNVEDTSNMQLTQRIAQIHGLTPIEEKYFESITFGDFLTYVFPFAANKENNEVMRVLLEYLMVFKYLVYALMSVKASCDFISTNDHVHDRQQRKFTAICMRLLVAAFADLKNNEFSLWHIEGLILTVLTLTMLFSEKSFVDTTKAPVSWIVHLQEARALLIKYNSIKAQSHHRKPDSPGITLAKQIFYCYDWSSKMSLRVSEISMTDLDDLLLLVENSEFLTDDPVYIRTLTKMGMMIPATNAHTDFHTFTTINSLILKIMHKLVELMSLMNSDKTIVGKKQVNPQDLSNLMGLINEAMNQKIVPGISGKNNFQISPENPAHPFYNGEDKIYLPECAYGIDVKDSGDVYHSWCDVALSLHACFLYLKVLTSPGLLYLPRSHPLIKLLIQQVLQALFFIKLKEDPSYMRDETLAETANFYLPKGLFDYRAIMIQLPFRLLIDLTDDETDFEKLELYFKGLLRFGCGSCSLAINRIQEKRVISKNRSTQSSKLNDRSDLDYETSVYPIY